MEKGKKFGLYLISGTIMVLLGLFYEVVLGVNEIITIIFTSAGGVIIITTVLKYTAYGEITHDERTRKLGSAALSFSWFLTFILVNIIFWIDYFDLIELTVAQTIGLILFFMVLSGSVLQWIYKKKGDLD
ncbi:MAG: hypothetical protein R6W73_09920 [Candidatus Saliniplasma sp.]